MRKPLALLLAITLLLPGCATWDSIKSQTAEVWRSGKIQKTLLIAAREVGIVVGKQVLSLAVSGRDFANKRDYLQGLTEGIWSHSGELLNPATVREIADAWTPDSPHWKVLATDLATDFSGRLKELGRDPTKEDVAAILNEYASGIYSTTETAE